MASVNVVHLLGNLGKSPETHTFDDGKIKVSFSLATSEKYKEETYTQWHNIVMFGKVAEIAAKYLKKGSAAYLMGKVTYRKYEKDGEDKWITEIKCHSLQLLDKRPSGSSDMVHEDLPPELKPEGPDDDLPF